MVTLRAHRFLPWTVILMAFGQGCTGETELFEVTAAALSESVGKDCQFTENPDFSLDPSETLVTSSDACGHGVCLGFRGEAHCSCRCDSAQDQSGLCTCPNGFTCQPSVILETGFNSAFEGGYCVRSQ